MKYQDSEGVEIAKQQMIAEKDVDAMSEIFDMFGDSTRLKIMNALFAHELCVSDLASLLEMSTSAISHQLANLKKTKLVRTRKIGKMVYYSMADEHIENIYRMALEHIHEKQKEVLEMSLKCRECKECNGIACRGEIPGLGGKDTGRSFIRNVEKMKEVKINLDVLCDDAPISTETEILSQKMRAPIFVAPVAGIKGNYGADISEYDYNCNVLKACEDTRIDVLKDKKFMAVAMDVDAAGLPLLRAGKTPVENKNAEKLRYVKENLNKPFIVKGVMSVHAALVAKEAGADAIVVSNHGGRVLDDCKATIEVLPEIVKAVGDDMTVFVDGGIRSGMDVFKCLALGADGVLIGRPFALSCVKDGSEGLEKTIRLYIDQLQSTMRMTGCHSIKDIDASKVSFLNE